MNELCPGLIALISMKRLPKEVNSTLLRLKMAKKEEMPVIRLIKAPIFHPNFSEVILYLDFYLLFC